MKASKANVKQAQHLAATSERLTEVEKKLDHILAILTAPKPEKKAPAKKQKPEGGSDAN